MAQLTLKEAIINHPKSKGLSLTDISIKMGVSNSTLYRIGSQTPSRLTYQKIADYLEMDAREVKQYPLK